MPEFLHALDQTLELKAVVTCTNPPPLKAIGPGGILRRERGSLGTHPWAGGSRVRPCDVVKAQEG
jgi:hypothetical protein